MTRKAIFDAVKAARGRGFGDADAAVLDAALDRLMVPRDGEGPTSRFDRALAAVLVHEGGYVNHPKDPGGATNQGVTQAVYDDWRVRKGLPKRSVREIDSAEVSAIYRRDYWNRVKADDLPPGVDYAVFDLAVNSGVNRAARFLQAVVGVSQDGTIGPATIAAVKSMSAREVITDLLDKRLAFLRRLNTWPTFGEGWAARCAGVRKLAMEMAG